MNKYSLWSWKNKLRHLKIPGTSKCSSNQNKLGQFSTAKRGTDEVFIMLLACRTSVEL